MTGSASLEVGDKTKLEVNSVRATKMCEEAVEQGYPAYQVGERVVIPFLFFLNVIKER